MACIGTGRMGHGDMNACLLSGLEPETNAHIVAVCDLDRRRARHAKIECEASYAQKLTDRPRPTIEMFEDYRELLSREDIDGVTISTPDHWHALVAIAAVESGKAVYLQKPLTYTVAEGQKLVAAVRRHDVVLQTGSQQRSDRQQIEFCSQHGVMWLGSGLTDPDISLAAILALYGAYGLTKPAALNGPQFLTASVLTVPLRIEQDQTHVPTGPDLGIEIDEQQVIDLMKRSGGDKAVE